MFLKHFLFLLRNFEKNCDSVYNKMQYYCQSFILSYGRLSWGDFRSIIKSDTYVHCIQVFYR